MTDHTHIFNHEYLLVVWQKGGKRFRKEIGDMCKCGEKK
jgi:hypothetical protein